MRARIIVLAILALIIPVICFPAGSAPSRADADKLYAEKSYALAAAQYDTLLAAEKDPVRKRELTWWLAMAKAKARRMEEAQDLLESLTVPPADDVWAGRAHWQLEPRMGDTQRWWPRTTSATLEHLRAADRILSREKPADLVDFYREAFHNLVGSGYVEKKEDREYLWGFFDRLIPLLKTPHDISLAHLHRARNAGFVPAENRDDEKIRLMRQITKEFPETAGGVIAQLEIGQYFYQRRDYVTALRELRTLLEQYPKALEVKEANSLIDKITREELLFNVYRPFLPGEKLEFTVTARNTGEARVALVPFDPARVLKSQKTHEWKLDEIQGSPSRTERLRFPTNDKFMPTTASLNLGEVEPGAYILRIEAGKARASSVVLVSSLTVVSNTANGVNEFWAVDSKTGRPREGVRILVGHDWRSEQSAFLKRPVAEFHQFADVVTDPDGFATFKNPDRSYGQIFVTASDGSSHAVLGPLSSWYNSREERPMVYGYTDRPVYRPQQKVYWRAIVRERSDGDFKAPKDGALQVRITDPRGTEVKNDKDIHPNEFGSISGDYTLPDRAPLGEYGVTIQDASGNRWLGSFQFRVEEYKKPEYEVTVTTADRLVKAGATVKGRIEAKYLFGGAVAGAKVSYTVRRTPRYFWGWNLVSDVKSDLGWFDSKEPQERPYRGGGDIVASGNGTMDEDGKFEFSFDAKVPPKDKNARPQPRRWWDIWPPAEESFDFRVEATVTDKSRRNIDGAASIIAGEKSLRVAAQPARRLYTPGDRVKVELASTNLGGDPVAARGTLYVEKVKWLRDEKKEEVTTLTTLRVDINASGTLEEEWRVPAGESGCMRFLLLCDDPFGGQVSAYGNFTVADENTKDVYFRYQGVQVTADASIYAIGDTARILILSEHPDAVAWFWIDSGSGNLEKRALPLPNRTNILPVKITEGFVPNTKVHVVVVRDQQVLSDEAEIIVPPVRKVLRVDVTADKPEYKPGESGELEVVARDHEGKPVKAEFSVSLFDRAILYIAPDAREDIRRSFYGQRRPLNSQLQNSASAPNGFRQLVPGDDLSLLWSFDSSGDGHAERYFQARYSVSRGDVYKVKNGGAVTLNMADGVAFAGVPVMAPPASAAAGAFRSAGFGVAESKEADQLGEGVAQPRVRSDFRDSAFWNASVITDADGRARVKVTFPDSLTTWKAVAVGTTADTRVGNAEAERTVRKNLMVRLQAPRFFRERDRLTISAIVNNRFPEAKKVRVVLDAAGLKPAGSAPAEQVIEVPAGGEKRVDWEAEVPGAGEAVLQVKALASGESDAAEMKFPVLPHGIDKFVAFNGTSNDETSSGLGRTVASDGGSVRITQLVTVPRERIHGTTRLTVIANPSLASTIRGALPTLIKYPYGCVEQTLNRFVPAAVAAGAFKELNIPRDTEMEKSVEEVTKAGLERLASFQHGDGSWGWWQNDSASEHMTALVVHGLTLAKQAGLEVEQGMFQRGLEAVRRDVAAFSKGEKRGAYWRDNDLHTLALQLLVLNLNGLNDREALEHLWGRRDELNANGLAMLARVLYKANRHDDARVARRNLENFVVFQAENGTARFGDDRRCWYWWQDPVESTSQALMAYLESDPSDPRAMQAMKWLALNRTAAWSAEQREGLGWKSTKATAQAVFALCAYMKERRETASEMAVTIEVPGQKRDFRIDPDNFWKSQRMEVVLEGDAVPDGQFPVTITRTGNGMIFYSVYAEYFTKEEGIKKAGNEIYVERTYEKVVRKAAKPGSDVKEVESFEPVQDGDTVKSGDELRVTLKVRSLNDYEYIVFEDAKPAGMEPVDLQSGSLYAGFCSNMELRDQFVSFFVTHLPQGDHRIEYRCRAEIPGVFHTMPTRGYAMYSPELRANSDELVVKVKDVEP